MASTGVASGLIIVFEALVLGLLGAVGSSLVGVLAGRAAWDAAARAVGIGGARLPVPAGVVIGVAAGVVGLSLVMSVVPAILASRSVPAEGLKADD